MDELTKQAAGINIHGSDLSHSETGSIKTELADNGTFTLRCPASLLI
jgi:hypothetical protein